jgi:Ca2+-binding RTX toxin-like protein
MSTITVSTTAALTAALKTAHAGDNILLASGTYSGLAVKNVNFAANVTISSADSTHQAVLTDFSINSSSGLTFTNLELSTVNSTIATSSYAFQVGQSSNILFSGLNIHGSLDNNPGNDVGGFLVRNSTNITMTGSQFQQLSNAFSQLDGSNLTVTNNSFHDIRSDGIDTAGSSNVLISGNSLTNFAPGSSTEHPDAIQFWTTGTTSSASDITISNNTITRGSGSATQGIFMRDEVGSLPYQNVTITGNTVSGEMYNGISVDHINNLSLSNNTVTALSDMPSWISVLDSVNTTMSDNNSSAYTLTNTTFLSQLNNKLAGVTQAATVMSSITATLGTLSHTLVLTGTAAISGGASTANDTVYANNAGDRLYGGGDNNVLVGGSGNDVIMPRGGTNDILTGGGGKDSFQFALQTGKDKITDFGQNGDHDILDISAFLNAGMKPTLTDVGNDTIISFANSAATITLLSIHSHDLIANSLGFTH